MMGLVQYSAARHRALQFSLAAICFSVISGTAQFAKAQQISAALGSTAPKADEFADARVDAPIPLLSLAQIAADTAGPANPQDGKLYLSLRQAFKMALENNLDLQVEQID